MKRSISVIWMIFLYFVLTSNAAVDWEKEFVSDADTLFLAHFNTGFAADFAKGSPHIEKFGDIRQTDGKFGRSLIGFNKAQNYVTIPVKNNFDVKRGTIEMWIRPNFDYDKAPEKFCIIFYCDADDGKTVYKNCAYMFYRQRARCFAFAWWADGEMALASSGSQYFKKGDWLHLSCFWGGEANILAIMVNGEMGGTSKIPGRWENNPRELILGKGKALNDGGQRSAYSDIDEVMIKNAFSSNVYEADRNLEVDGKKYFYCPRNKEADPMLLQKAEDQTGFLVFRRDPRMVYPDSVPQKEELVHEIKILTTPGELKAVYFSLYGLRNLENIKMQASLLDETTSGNVKMDKEIQIKKASFWPQKSDWATRIYHIIPELLEQFVGGPVRENECSTFWIDFKTSKMLKEGKYKGAITIANLDNNRTVTLPLELTVLPFKLLEPEGKQWLMYIDRYPEKNFDQQKKMLEALKDYGISGLILNFAISSEFKFETQNGKISGFQSDYLRDILNIYNTVGMKGPIALWFQFKLEYAIAQALGIKNPAFSEEWKNKVKVGLHQGVPLIDAFIKKHAPDVKWYFYGRDEPPPDGEIYQRVRWMYKIMRELKVNTCNTYYMPYKDKKEIEEFIPLLNADISGSPTLKDLKLLAQNACQFWYLGGGCYTSQEGGLMPNRFLSGFGFYQTGGEAHVSWVWQRINNDPFNEFKEVPARYREDKNPMITYPARKADASEQYISTLQWEGLREGITDYKYIYTLNHYIGLAKKNNLQKDAQAAENKFNEVLGKIPSVFVRDSENRFKLGDYYMKPGNFTDAAANECRAVIAEEITKLVRLLDSKKNNK